MSRDDLPLPSERVRSLLDAERRRPEADADVARRVREHLLTSIAASGPALGPREGAQSTSSLAHGVRAKVGAALAATFLAGGGAGAVAYRAWAPKLVVMAPPAQAPGSASATSEIPAASAPAEDGSMSTASATGPRSALFPTPTTSAQPPRPSPSTSSPESSSRSGRDTDLGHERALLEQARMALARGQTQGALEALEAHAREFPAGRMSEEREALVVQALAQGGRLVEARAKAARFRARFPKSVFLSVVDAALEWHDGG